MCTCFFVCREDLGSIQPLVFDNLDLARQSFCNSCCCFFDVKTTYYTSTDGVVGMWAYATIAISPTNSYLSIIRAYGVDEKLLHCIRSYLLDRSIQVVLDDYKSKVHYINPVPQGSVLSPTLFLIFINDRLSIASDPIHSC